MNIHIIELETKFRLSLSMLPQSVSVRGASTFLSYNTIKTGEIKVPNGTALKTFDWEGILPGASSKNASYIKSYLWQAPEQVLNIWDKWRINGTKLRLMVTETHINNDVYLNEISSTAIGGRGDFNYSISFIEIKDIEIHEIQSTNLKTVKSTIATTSTTYPKLYIVKSGDTLWRIAQKFCGDGGRWLEIYELNRDKLANPDSLQAGLVLTLPSFENSVKKAVNKKTSILIK